MTPTGTGPRTEVRVNTGTSTTIPGQATTGPKAMRAQLVGTEIHEVKVIRTLAHSAITTTVERSGATRAEEDPATAAEEAPMKGEQAPTAAVSVVVVSTAVVAGIANKR